MCVMDEKMADLTDWKEFTDHSDVAYASVRSGSKAIDVLSKHNIIARGDLELSCILHVCEKIFNCKPHGNALDICCGAGYFTGTLASYGFKSTGVDLNRDAVEIATRNHPDCTFIAADVTNVTGMDDIGSQPFGIIIAREAHPFSRLDDVEFHQRLVRAYLRKLNFNGFLVIGHARKGGSKSYRSINYKSIKAILDADGHAFTGPYFISIIKRLPKRLYLRPVLSFVSFLTSILQRFTKKRWIEVFIIQKRNSA